MGVYINSEGKYYQADSKKDAGDATIEHPTRIMLEYLTETPVTVPEFGVNVIAKEIEKINTPVPPESQVPPIDESLAPAHPIATEEPIATTENTLVSNL